MAQADTTPAVTADARPTVDRLYRPGWRRPDAFGYDRVRVLAVTESAEFGWGVRYRDSTGRERATDSAGWLKVGWVAVP